MSLDPYHYRPSVDATAMEERMDAIRLKAILGMPLTERELMCLQIEENGFGCGAGRSSDLLGTHPYQAIFSREQ